MSAGFALVGPLGPLELGIILLILIVIFGPKRLPGIGQSLGQGMREFKDAITGGKSDDDDDKQELPSGSDAEPQKRSEPAMAAVDADAGAADEGTSRAGQ